MIEAKGTGLTSRGSAFSPDGDLLFPNGLPWGNPQLARAGVLLFRSHQDAAETVGPQARRTHQLPDGRRYAVLGKRGSDSPLTHVACTTCCRCGGSLEASGLEGGFSPTDGGSLSSRAGASSPRRPGDAMGPGDPPGGPGHGTVAGHGPSPGQTWETRMEVLPDGKSGRLLSDWE